MDTQDVYKLAVQAALAAALRELVRIEREEAPGIADGLSLLVYGDGSIDVTICSPSGTGPVGGYSL